MRTNRIYPLTGLGAVAFALAGHFVHGAVPHANDSLAKVSAFYLHHAGTTYWGSVLIGIAAALFLGFLASLRTHLRRATDADVDTAIATAYAGGVVFVVGLTLIAGIGVALGHSARHMDPVAIQSL